ncbi:hypothetical protein Acr_06g0000470 [Actinidia rufa]|uniref:HMA domain-containing protein n=1 Tax=Actinidia rufa TaxID=165716 RepID=A0A7J0ERB0_9ERIC|nr:hypothetical protein Acr_06g0000470 [Actinidia rufa]
MTLESIQRKIRKRRGSYGGNQANAEMERTEGVGVIGREAVYKHQENADESRERAYAVYTWTLQLTDAWGLSSTWSRCWPPTTLFFCAEEKQKSTERSQQDQADDASTRCSNGTSVETNSTTQTGQADNSSKWSSEATTKTYSVIVLGLSMHCEGCADTIKQHLHSFDEVQQVDIDMSNHKVTVRGEIANPKIVVERLRRRTNKPVALISPVLKEKTEEERKEDKRKEEERNKPKMVEVVLKVYMHCEGCAQDIKSCIHKMEGVLTVVIDMSTSQVTVKGAFEPHQLVEYINKNAGKHATIMKKTPLMEKEGENKNEKQGEKMNIKDYSQIYPPGGVYAPQFFSEENPNACSVM